MYDVVLRGSLPGATTAGILLLTKARQLGLPLKVSVVGSLEEAPKIVGPAVLYAPVLASCGVGREAGHGSLVVVGGAPGSPLMVTAAPHGVEGWFFVNRNGQGHHPATAAFVRLSRDPRVGARRLAKDVRRAMELLGMSTDPAVLDVLFGAEVPPLTRLSIALRAGRALSGGRGEPITRFVAGQLVSDHDPLRGPFEPTAFLAELQSGAFRWILDGLSPVLRDTAESWLAEAATLANEDGGRDLALVHAIVELASHLVQLPPYSILPPLGAAEDSVSVGLKAGLSADEEQDAMSQLTQMFRFLGGRYVSAAPFAHEVCNEPAPTEYVAKWTWFCAQVRQGKKDADALWPSIMEPPQ